MKGVVIQRSRIVRARPRIDQWKAKFTIRILDEMLNPKIIKEVLEAAGKYKGLLDYRPKYGRFHITKWETSPHQTVPERA